MLTLLSNKVAILHVSWILLKTVADVMLRLKAVLILDLVNEILKNANVSLT